MYVRNLYTQHGALIYNPEMYNHVLYRLTQPGTPGNQIFYISDILQKISPRYREDI